MLSIAFDLRRRWRRGCRRGLGRLCGLALALPLTGCQGSLQPEWDPQPIDAGQSVIRFEDADFDPKRTRYLLQHDPRSDNDIYTAQFVGSDAFATLAAIKTGPGFVVEERSPESYVRDLLADAKLSWGTAGRAATAWGEVPWRMFEIGGQPFSCVGFGQPRGESSDDRGRKSDLMFGYFCQSDARPMSAATATDLIGKVSLSGRR